LRIAGPPSELIATQARGRRASYQVRGDRSSSAQAISE
jgi:hypothetical protein